MTDDFKAIQTLEELWDWCKKHRESAWRFPEKWGVQGYLGRLPIGIVADEPGRRSLKHRKLGLPYPNDEDVFTRPEDEGFYGMLEKYGLENAHVMDAHISRVTDRVQDEQVFLKQMEIIKFDALLIMDINKSRKGWGPWSTVERDLKNWRGALPRLYPIYHYSNRSRVPQSKREAAFRSTLAEVAINHPNLASMIRVP